MAGKHTRIPNNLRYHRKLWGYTLKDIAFLLELVSTSQLVRWEKGKERPSLDNVLLLAYIYRTPCESLYLDHRTELVSPLLERERLLTDKLQHHYDG